MITCLLIRDMLAHAELDLELPDAEGHVTIAGPSEAGKSTLLEATCFVLFGQATNGKEFPVEAIRDGASKVSVSLVSPWGSTLSRTMTRSRSFTRSVEKDGEVKALPTEDLFRGKLGPVGARPDLARVLMVPMQWVPLLEANLGRPLRDLVLSLLPGTDARAVIAELVKDAGHELRADDPVTEADAKARQTATNKLRDQAVGRLEAARARMNACKAPATQAPATAGVESARATLGHEKTWAEYDARVARRDQALALREQQVQARDRWRASQAEAGERPVVDAFALQAVDEALRALRAERADVEDKRLAARRDYQNLQGRLAHEEEHGTTCASCGQALPEDKLPDVEATRRQLAGVLELAQGYVAEVERIDGEIRTKEASRAPLAEAAAKVREYDAAARERGQEPLVDVEPPAIGAPAVPRPSPEALAAANARVQEATRAEGAMAEHTRERAAAQRELDQATAEETKAQAEAARIVIVLDAARRAPSEIVARQQGAIGDLGCVSLRFPPKENSRTPEIEVLIDGRPWWLASDGRKVVADLQLRAGLRRLAELDPVTLFVDRAQDWTGEWPDVPGPVVYLLSRAGEFEVRAGTPGPVAKAAAA